MTIIDQRKPGTLATTVLRSKSETRHLVFVGFVEFGEFGAEFVFGNVGAVRVEDVAGFWVHERLVIANESF